MAYLKESPTNQIVLETVSFTIYIYMYQIYPNILALNIGIIPNLLNMTGIEIVINVILLLIVIPASTLLFYLLKKYFNKSNVRSEDNMAKLYYITEKYAVIFQIFLDFTDAFLNKDCSLLYIIIYLAYYALEILVQIIFIPYQTWKV